MLKRKPSREQTLITYTIISVLSVIAGWMIDGWQLASLIAIALFAIFYLGRYIWMSNRYNFILRSATLAIVGAVALAGSSFFPNVFQAAIQHLFSNFNLPNYAASPFMLFFLFGLVTIVFYFTKNESSLRKHTNGSKPYWKAQLLNKDRSLTIWV